MPPVSLVAVPSDVAVRSVTMESMVRMPRRLKSLIDVFAFTVTDEPSVTVFAEALIEPNVATAGAAARGIVASAVELFSLASTAARRPGAGSDVAFGEPNPDVALTR